MREPDDHPAAPRRGPAPTPMADALLAGSARTRCQFQALPLSGGGALRGSGHAERYHRLFGAQQLAADALFAGAAFDSFFFPETVIRDAERLAADAFGAEGAMFVTSGTTVSNQIALAALVAPGMRVLADRSCHQSVHFSLHAAKARTDHIAAAHDCEVTGRSWFDLADLVGRVAAARASGEPYGLLVLNSASYDGVVYRLPAVVRALAEAGAAVPNVLVDEAWGSAAYFDARLRSCTAMEAAREAGGGINVVSTHSVHKSMSALRQGSMLAWRGERGLEERLRHARFKLHTTSPSYPILASLDLARAQMVDEGEAITARARALAEAFERGIETGARTTRLSVNRTALPPSASGHVALDPTKVSINVGGLGRPPDAVKQLLHDRYGVWVRRSTARSILFNVHIGVRSDDVELALGALGDLQDEGCAAPGGERESPHFVIPYPPGIPILMPGEAVTAAALGRIAAAEAAGAHVFTIS